MCLFPLSAYSKTELYGSHLVDNSIKQYDCGACPECLRKRANLWALRAVYESKFHAYNCMITLTYDNFVRDPRTGKILGETIPDPDLKVNQRDIQLFIKRLRKYFFGNSQSDMKYIACAEYGSCTHRAHYHLLLFGIRFDDYHFYKKSRRGNPIYMSNILTKLWNHGICTIDSVNIHSGVARYCTKYLAKNRSDKTFMLVSQRLGLEGLLRDFNGISYFVDGREYPIPRRVWQEVIFNRYSMDLATFRYVNRKFVTIDERSSCQTLLLANSVDGVPSSFEVCVNEDEFCLNFFQRSMFRQIRNDDVQYQKYLLYWQRKGGVFERLRPPVLQRIYALDDRKFHNYKIAALHCYCKRKGFYSSFPAPGSNCVSAYERARFLVKPHMFSKYRPVTCPYPSRPNRASDTKFIKLIRIFDDDPFFKKNIQLFIDF